MAAFPHDLARLCAKCLTRQTGKISTLLINNPAGKFCLARPEKTRARKLSPHRLPVRARNEKPIAIVVLRESYRASTNGVFIVGARDERVTEMRKIFPVKSIFTLPRQCVASRLLGPASPTASPESEFLSHG
jgi:hypothetical protein